MSQQENIMCKACLARKAKKKKKHTIDLSKTLDQNDKERVHWFN